MTVQIENFRIQQYKSNLQLKSQQMLSKFAGTVTEASYVGEKISPVSYLHPTDMDTQTERAQNKNYRETPTSRRWVMPGDLLYRAELIETQDQVQMLDKVEGGYAEAFTAAGNRRKDLEIIKAFFSTARTGKNGEDSTAFPASQLVNVSVGGGGGAATGLNWDKLVAGTEIFTKRDVDLETAGQIHVGLDPLTNSIMMKQAEVISDRYKITSVVKNNLLMELGGMRFIHSNQYLRDSNNYVRLPMWVKDGMHLGTWKELGGDVFKNTAKVGNPMEVYADMMVGSTRLDEDKVIEIKCAVPT